MFDRAYYERYYHDPRTRVIGPQQARRLGDFVCSYLKHLGIEVDRVLDLGCGLGLWQRSIRKHFPQAEYVGVEISDYLCDEYGWEHGSVVDYDDDPADLVVCQGVLQYLDARDARRAIRNLARLTEGALYLEALTRRDWNQAAAQDITDGDVYLRQGAWYRKHLRPHFIACGGGVFVPRSTAPPLFDLEMLEE